MRIKERKRCACVWGGRSGRDVHGSFSSFEKKEAEAAAWSASPRSKSIVLVFVFCPFSFLRGMHGLSVHAMHFPLSSSALAHHLMPLTPVILPPPSRTEISTSASPPSTTTTRPPHPPPRPLPHAPRDAPPSPPRPPCPPPGARSLATRPGVVGWPLVMGRRRKLIIASPYFMFCALGQPYGDPLGPGRAVPRPQHAARASLGCHGRARFLVLAPSFPLGCYVTRCAWSAPLGAPTGVVRVPRPRT